MNVPESLGIIAGNGVYPRLLADSARNAGVKKIVAAAFTDETDSALKQHVDLIEWMRVGQMGRLLKFFREQNIHHAIMADKLRRRTFLIYGRIGKPFSCSRDSKNATLNLF